ncbi:Calmodulin [Tritrichomonas foetus]|uniref:Calmodulin n=1 Tax=Tritrichomonas foetus TaxID=1144522 RepID=A0A1J4KH42_9EUKA|nr:Calmodulin [Tritrichomonas foetus]|eukprot:OHT10499.1 Calmodulin [Tritrichomonas foetus]
MTLTEETREHYKKKLLSAPDGQPPLTKHEIQDIFAASGAQANDQDVDLAYDLLMNTWAHESRFDDLMMFIDQVKKTDSTAILKELFDSLDANNDGVLQYDEVLNGFQSLGIEISPEEVNQIFADADENGNQLLEFDEFAKVVGKHM